MNNQTRNAIIFKVQDIVDTFDANCDFDPLMEEIFTLVKSEEEVTIKVVKRAFNWTQRDQV